MPQTQSQQNQTDREVHYLVGARTDRGMQRSANEDSFAVLDLAATRLASRVEAAFVVADGMGGLTAGDIASGEAVRIVQETLTEQLARPNVPFTEALATALRRANDVVHAMALEAAGAIKAERAAASADDPTERRGANAPLPGIVMGTTCVAGVIENGTLHLAHAGDSRAYLFRGGQLTRLTRDHSFVEERVIAGDMTEAEARTSRYRNLVTRAIGIDPTVEPDLRSEPLAEGDTVLLCSDGLTTMVDDEEIERTLAAAPNARAHPDKAAGALVDLANKKGGSDNITVVVVRVAGPDGIFHPRRPPQSLPHPFRFAVEGICLWPDRRAVLLPKPPL